WASALTRPGFTATCRTSAWRIRGTRFNRAARRGGVPSPLLLSSRPPGTGFPLPAPGVHPTLCALIRRTGRDYLGAPRVFPRPEPPMPSSAASAHATPASLRTWLGLAVLVLPTILLALDMTVLHLAVPRLSADLRPSGVQLLWILDIYGFLIAGFLITMGTLGDRIGRRKLLLTGAAAFGAASALAAFATSAEALIALRALMGIAGATLMPSTLPLIRNMFHVERQRTLAITVWMTGFIFGSAIGPLIGGLLLEYFWWGSVFLLGVPVMVLLLVTAPFLLPEFRDESA